MVELPVLGFESQQEWESWLEENHAISQGARLKLAKKGSGRTSVSYAEAVESALCYGWIDGQSNRLDDVYWLQKFTPRRARSPWSQINKGKVQTLIEQGRMRPAGLREIERAQADGRWDAAYEPSSRIAVPEDLQAALDQNPEARDFFATLNSANRYAVLYRITTAKKPDTRQRRIAQYVEMLAAGKTIYD